MTSDKLKDLTATRKWAHRKLIDQDSETYRAFVEMEAATFKDGALKKQHKELIAIGISVQDSH